MPSPSSSNCCRAPKTPSSRSSTCVILSLFMLTGFIIKVLQVFEEEIVERQESKAAALYERQTLVKDGIRAGIAPDLVFVINQLLQNPAVFNEDIVDDALEVLSQLVDWLPLELFVPMIDLIKQYLQSPKFRVNALEALHSFVHKGMDYP